MGLKVPFKPQGFCANCKFSQPIPSSHYASQNYSLFCRRFPPTGPQTAPGNAPWNVKVPVQDSEYCGEWVKE